MPGDEEIKVTEILLDFAVQYCITIDLTLLYHNHWFMLLWLCIYFGQCFTF